ncbi:hypothetical protein AbraIFM66951_007767 [Aspergillus brasiliensis]|uniref:Complex III subunit 9 n=1 Tax=Aspergillus brasiliensis TaxID=319629 RepID=A0A9W5YM37_9EURO|nr:hypothetical protein AbraCBS73388_004920 [Aspergillus brasiliensis]GKZ45179.1 hypothetical protein AbraIFM66951_007767 [Aspergillus brasiliensis]
MAGAIASAIYQHVSPFTPDIQGLIRRNAVYLTTIFASAFAFELTFDTASNKIWDSFNRGRQWKDIKHQYLNKADDEDDE